jgi:hypothetical protein
MKEFDALVVDADNKKIGYIECPQNLWDLMKSTANFRPGIPFSSVTHKYNTWADKDAVVLQAWKQIIYSSNNFEELRTNGKTLCMNCGEKTVVPKRFPLSKKSWVGIYCTNPKCSMYNAVIPAKMFDRIPPKNVIDALGLVKL